MDAMYNADVNSTNTELSAGISDTATTIGVVDASVLPPAPNIAVIGYDTDNAETIKYTGLDGTNNNITGVTRGFQGTATPWGVETKVARTFTAYDHDTFKGNIEELDTSKVEQSEFGNHSGNNSAHHDRYTDDEARNALSGHKNDNSAHHSRYLDSEAVSAVSSADDYVKNTGDTVNGSLTATDGYKTGNFEIVYNSDTDSLGFNYIG